MNSETQTWLKLAKAALLAEGFKRDPKQFRKPGQQWGLIRQEDDQMQLHVRAFEDGRLESEIELSNKFVQHLWSKRVNAHPEISAILSGHGFPTDHVSETFMPITGSAPDKEMPRMRTKNTHVAGTVLLGAAILVAQFLIRKKLQQMIPATKVLAFIPRK